MSSTPSAEPLKIAINHEYNRPPAGISSRSPCPALNTLANHGYIHREGTDLTFFEVLHAISFVYNLSYPLALLLTFAGFATCGKVSWKGTHHLGPLSTTIGPPSRSKSPEPQPTVSWPAKVINCLVALANTALSFVPSLTLDLNALSARGGAKIAHDASLVHPNGEPSTAPDRALLAGLLARADAAHGLGLADLARYHAERLRASPPLDGLHSQIAVGECALMWEALSNKYDTQCGGVDTPSSESKRDLAGASPECVVPASRLEQWLGEERLPDGWWGAAGVRPEQAIGVLGARRMANLIDRLGAARSK